MYTIGGIVDTGLHANRERRMTTEERIARLEGQIEHMATKADIAQLSAIVERQAATLTWRMILVAVLVNGAMQAIGIGALLQFLPR